MINLFELIKLVIEYSVYWLVEKVTSPLAESMLVTLPKVGRSIQT